MLSRRKEIDVIGADGGILLARRRPHLAEVAPAHPLLADRLTEVNVRVALGVDREHLADGAFGQVWRVLEGSL